MVFVSMYTAGLKLSEIGCGAESRGKYAHFIQKQAKEAGLSVSYHNGFLSIYRDFHLVCGCPCDMSSLHSMALLFVSSQNFGELWDLGCGCEILDDGWEGVKVDN